MKIKLLYIGKRLNGHSLNHCFLYKKQTMFFAHTKLCQIGYLYEAEHSKETTTLNRRPLCLGISTLTESQIEEYRVLSEIDVEARKHKSAVKKWNQSKTVNEAAKLLAPYIKNLDFRQIKYFVDALLTRLRK